MRQQVGLVDLLGIAGLAIRTLASLTRRVFLRFHLPILDLTLR